MGRAEANLTIENSCATGDVSTSGSDSYSGGLVGYASNTLNIENSYATGKVSASASASASASQSYSYSGGLVGYARNTLNIENSYAIGKVSASVSASQSYSYSYSGGLVGYAYFNSTANISNSYATSDVSASGSLSYSGGLVGFVSSANIYYSYASGIITATGGNSNYAGGIFGGHNSASGSIITSVYYNSEGVSQENGYGTALSSEDMMKKASFIGWDFTNIWSIKEGETYPYLKTYAIQPIADQIYTGSQIEPEPSVSKKSDGTVLTKDTDYTLTYEANINAGTGIINIIGQGDYADLQESITFNILKTDQTVPPAPTMANRTSTSITLNEIFGAEYRLGTDGAWQDNVTFTNLEPDTEYAFYARLKETATHEASPASDASKISTLPIYTVTFVDHDGTVLKVENVEHGSPATASEDPTRTGYTFIGWDAEFDEVTDHLTVTATYAIITCAADEELVGSECKPTQILLPQIASGQIEIQSKSNVILLNNLPVNTKVELYNLQGKLLYSGNSGNSQNLQIGNQAKGMYIVKVGTQKYRATVR